MNSTKTDIFMKLAKIFDYREEHLEACMNKLDMSKIDTDSGNLLSWNHHDSMLMATKMIRDQIQDLFELPLSLKNKQTRRRLGLDEREVTVSSAGKGCTAIMF